MCQAEGKLVQRPWDRGCHTFEEVEGGLVCVIEARRSGGRDMVLMRWELLGIVKSGVRHGRVDLGLWSFRS